MMERVFDLFFFSFTSVVRLKEIFYETLSVSSMNLELLDFFLIKNSRDV